MVVDQKMLLSENIYFDIIKTGTERLAIYKNRVLCGPDCFMHFYMTVLFCFGGFLYTN